MKKIYTTAKYDSSLDLTATYYPPKDILLLKNNRFGYKETKPVGKTVYLNRNWIDQEYQTWGIACNVLFEVLISTSKGVKAKIFYVKE